MTVKDLASAIGMSETNIHRCVRENKIQAQDLEKISKVLKVSIVEFFDESNLTVGALATGKEGIAVGSGSTVDARRMAGGDCDGDEKTLEHRIEVLEKEVAHLEARMREKDERIADLKETIETKERIISLMK